MIHQHQHRVNERQEERTGRNEALCEDGRVTNSARVVFKLKEFTNRFASVQQQFRITF